MIAHQRAMGMKRGASSVTVIIGAEFGRDKKTWEVIVAIEADLRSALLFHFIMADVSL